MITTKKTWQCPDCGLTLRIKSGYRVLHRCPEETEESRSVKRRKCGNCRNPLRDEPQETGGAVE